MLLLLPGLLGACAENPPAAAAAAAMIGGAELPGLRTLLSRASRRGSAGRGESPESLLFQVLGFGRESGDWPSAAVSAVADGSSMRPEAWIRADPVHLEAGLSDLRLEDPRELGLEIDESVELCAAINEVLDGVPGRIEALAPARWYIGLERVPRLRTREPSLAVGGAVAEALPRGPDAVVWLRTLTEIQMLLHDVPVNRARSERGAPGINSVWLWGAGRLPPLPGRPPGARLWSDSVLARGFGRVLGLACEPLRCGAERLLGHACAPAPALVEVVYCDALHYAVRLDDWPAWIDGLKGWEAQWFEPLRRALWSGKLASVRIESGGGCWHEVSASARWRWWQPARPLSDHVSKAARPPDAEPDMPPPGRAEAGGSRRPLRDPPRGRRSGDS